MTVSRNSASISCRLIGKGGHQSQIADGVEAPGLPPGVIGKVFQGRVGEDAAAPGPGQLMLEAEMGKIRGRDEGEGAFPEAVKFFVHQRRSRAYQP